MAKIYMKQHSSSNNTEGTGIKCSSLAKKILLKLSVTRCVRVEVSSVESNETTAAI